MISSPHWLYRQRIRRCLCPNDTLKDDLNHHSRDSAGATDLECRAFCLSTNNMAFSPKRRLTRTANHESCLLHLISRDLKGIGICCCSFDACVCLLDVKKIPKKAYRLLNCKAPLVCIRIFFVKPYITGDRQPVIQSEIRFKEWPLLTLSCKKARREEHLRVVTEWTDTLSTLPAFK